MIRQTILLPLAMISIFLLSSCRKEDDAMLHDSFYAELHPNLYPLLFDSGSYWVYQDSISNNLDSTTVMGISKNIYSITPGGPGQGSPGSFEHFKIDYISHPTNTTFSEDIFASYISRGMLDGGYSYISTKNVGDSIMNAEIENILENFLVQGQLYHNVVKMRVQADAFIDQDYYLFYADSIGVIRKELRDGVTIANAWDLLRYNTVLKHE